jgi:hypothetical protein
MHVSLIYQPIRTTFGVKLRSVNYWELLGLVHITAWAAVGVKRGFRWVKTRTHATF